jgi:outer membrane protein OmpA-like peptidoglycan-associated protein
MTKKIIILSAILLVVPACKKSSRYATQRTKQASHQVAGSEFAGEELGAFVVKDEENSFNPTAVAMDDELKATGSELKVGDLRADSAQYGLKTIYFEYDKYKTNELPPDQKSVLSNDISVVKSLIDKGYRIIIEGHACDSAGSTAYNMSLSEKRAQAVKDLLDKENIQGDVYVVGRGCEHLVVPSGDKQQQAPNRRVEIYADLLKA